MVSTECDSCVQELPFLLTMAPERYKWLARREPAQYQLYHTSIASGDSKPVSGFLNLPECFHVRPQFKIPPGQDWLVRGPGSTG